MQSLILENKDQDHVLLVSFGQLVFNQCIKVAVQTLLESTAVSVLVNVSYVFLTAHIAD